MHGGGDPGINDRVVGVGGETQGRIDHARLIDEGEILTTHTARESPAPATAHQARRSKTQRGQRRIGHRGRRRSTQEKIGEDEHEFAHIAYVIEA